MFGQNLQVLKLQYYLNSVNSNLKTIKESVPKLKDYIKHDKNNERYVLKSTELMKDIELLNENKQFSKMRKYLQELFAKDKNKDVQALARSSLFALN